MQEFLGQFRRSVSGEEGGSEQRQELVQEFLGQFRRSVSGQQMGRIEAVYEVNLYYVEVYLEPGPFYLEGVTQAVHKVNLYFLKVF